MIEEIVIIAVIAFMFFWIWMLGDATFNHKIPRSKRRLWLLLIGATFIPGALIYFVLKKRRVNK